VSSAFSTVVLAAIPSPDRGVWYLGPVPIRAYALCIIAGIVVAVLWGERRYVARGGEAGVVTDVAVFAVPFGLVGGRLYHVITDWQTYFGPGGNPIDALKIWQGGLGIWGAVALGAVGAWIGCRRRGVPLPFFADAVAPGIVTAQAIGRIGNWFNQELYGAPTTLPWGLEIYRRVNPDTGALDGLTGVVLDHTPIETVHPTFLYELIWDLLVAALVVWADRRFRLGHGRAFAVYVAGYTAGRFWIEQLRTDYATRVFGDLRINVVVSAVVFVGAVLYLVAVRMPREVPVPVGPDGVEVEPDRGETVSVGGRAAAASAGVAGIATGGPGTTGGAGTGGDGTADGDPTTAGKPVDPVGGDEDAHDAETTAVTTPAPDGQPQVATGRADPSATGDERPTVADGTDAAPAEREATEREPSEREGSERASEPEASEPEASETASAATDPTPDSVVPDPVAPHSVASDSVASDPVASDLVASDPVASDLAASDSAAPDATSAEPVATDRDTEAGAAADQRSDLAGDGESSPRITSDEAPSASAETDIAPTAASATPDAGADPPAPADAPADPDLDSANGTGQDRAVAEPVEGGS
jgi:prolipoprotein diacylglyceryl transferase